MDSQPDQASLESAPEQQGASEQPNDSPAPTGKPSGWDVRVCLLALMVFLVAAVVRFIYLYQSAGNPTFENPIIDAQAYDAMARQVVDGTGLQNFFWQPAFYPLFLSFVYFLGDSSIVLAKIVQLLLGCVTCVLTYRLGERVFGRRVGVLAGLMLACYGPVVFFESELVASGWAAFWSVALVLLFLGAADRGSARTSFWLGVCGLLAILTRPTFAIFFVAGCCWLVVRFACSASRWRVLARCVPALVAGLLVVYLPAAKLGERATGRFGITPHSGGINFYIGNNPNTCETLTIRPGLRWADFTKLPERNGVEPDVWKKQAYFYGLVREYFNSDPGGYARGLVSKAVQFVSSREIPRNVDVYLFSQWSSLLRALVWKAGPFGFPFGVLLPLAVVGLIWNLRRIPLPIVFWLALFPAAVVLVFVTARYRVAVIPLTVMLAAAGCFSLVGFVKARAWGRVGVSAAVMVSFAVLSTIPGPFCGELPNYEAELYYALGVNAADAHDIDKAIALYSRTIEIAPDFADAQNNLGAEYYDRGQLDDAILHFGRAAELWPDSADTFYNLAAAYFKLGRTDEAIRNWNRVLELNPKNFTAHYLIANALLNQKRLEEAAEHYRQAVKLKPRFRKAVGNLGVTLQRLGQNDEAIVQYKRAIQLSPDDRIARDNLIKFLLKLERYSEAATECETALQRNPNNADWRFQYGRALEGLGRTNEAIRLYQQTLQLNPAHQGARTRLTEIATQRGGN